MSDDILDLRDLADDWRELLDDNGKPSNASEVARVRQFQSLCEQLRCEATPDGLEEYGNDFEPTLIGEWYFEQYARDLAEETGSYDPSASWPLNCIDWEKAADELRQDYTSVSFGGWAYLTGA